MTRNDQDRELALTVCSRPVTSPLARLLDCCKQAVRSSPTLVIYLQILIWCLDYKYASRLTRPEVAHYLIEATRDLADLLGISLGEGM